MGYVIGCMVAAVSFLLNRALFRRIGFRTVITFSPVLEELCKTLPAYFIGVSILTVHVTFGAIEGAYDFFQNGRTGILAALLSVTGHFLFGLMAIVALRLTADIYLAAAAGAALHLVWNMAVVRFF